MPRPAQRRRELGQVHYINTGFPREDTWLYEAAKSMAKNARQSMSQFMRSLLAAEVERRKEPKGEIKIAQKEELA